MPTSSSDNANLAPAHQRRPTWRQAAWLRGVVTIFGQAVVSGTRFATSVAVARYAGIEDLGVYSLAFSVIVISSNVGNALLCGPYTVFSPRESPTDRDSLAGSVMIHLVVATLGLAAVCLSISFLAPTVGYWARIGQVAQILALSLPMLLCRSFARCHALAHMRYFSALALDLAADTTHLLCLFALIQSNRFSGATAIGALAIGGTVATAIWLIRYGWRCHIRIDRVLPDLRRHLRFGSWEVAAEVVGTVQTYVMLWLLAGTRSATETGIYAACMTVVMLANPVIIGLASYYSPALSRRFADHGADGLHQLSRQSTAVMCGLMFLFMLFAVTVGDRFVAYVFNDPGCINQHLSIAMLALAMLASVGCFGAEMALWIREHNRLTFWASAAGASISVLAGLVLVPRYGTSGAAGTLLLGKSMISGLNIWFYRRLRQNDGNRHTAAVVGAP